MCRHKNSPDPLETMIDLFGRIPVLARSWVRHIINLPDRKLPPSSSPLLQTHCHSRRNMGPQLSRQHRNIWLHQRRPGPLHPRNRTLPRPYRCLRWTTVLYFGILAGAIRQWFLRAGCVLAGEPVWGLRPEYGRGYLRFKRTRRVRCRGAEVG